ncbi:MAG: hypothetical protein Q8L84_04905 [Hyphomonas sp.]|nr:hypothetical protein [Hyphomonas sp.]
MTPETTPRLETVPRPEFLIRAQACVRAANVAPTESLKSGWLEVAEGWLHLALPQKTRAQKDFQTALDAKHTGQKNSESVN